MAGERHVEFEVQGWREAFAHLLRTDDRLDDELRDLLDDLRQRGEHYIRLYAPAYSGELLRRVGSSMPIPSIQPSGFQLEASAGVREGDRVPLYVHGGTGIYKAGRLGASRAISDPGTPGYIRNRRIGKPLTFQKRGEPRKFKMWVRGQESNPFMLYAYQQLKPYAAGKVRRLFGRRESEGI